MKLILTDNAKAYFNEKNIDSITLNLPMRKVCCSGPYLPAVKVGKPKNMEDFDELIIDNIHIFKNKKIKYSRPRLNISVRKFMIIKEVYVFDPDTVCICSGGEKNT